MDGFRRRIFKEKEIAMKEKKSILAIIGSASENSANERLVSYISLQMDVDFNVTIYNRLKLLPHFDPEQSNSSPPQAIVEFRKLVDKADGILVCTPEYVFSIPSGLKNAIEWCVATTVFSDKPAGLITASASGQKGHEELQLIMKTVQAHFTDETSLLIEGVKGKINKAGEITDRETEQSVRKFITAFTRLLHLIP